MEKKIFKTYREKRERQCIIPIMSFITIYEEIIIIFRTKKG